MADSPFAQSVIFVTNAYYATLPFIPVARGTVYSANEDGKLSIINYGAKRGSEAADKTLELLKTDDVYISIDLDVLSSRYVKTEVDYGNGNMDLNFLLEYLKCLKTSGKRIIGADICGIKKWGSPDKKSLDTYASVLLALLDCDAK
jgi:arginase family enzyme